MLTVAVSAVLGLGLGFALMDLFESSDKSDETSDNEVPVADMGDILDVGGDNSDELDDETEGDTFIVGPGETVVGTDEADIFTINDERFADAPVTIGAGAGDDTLTLWREDEHANGQVLSDGSVVDGDDGNDTINVSGESIEVSGGAGDDFIDGFLSSSKLNGDAGNDTIVIETGGDGSFASGGSGDDVIDGRAIQNGGLYGGDGDDLILTTGGNQVDAGYVIATYGGEGDDTIRFDGSAYEFNVGDDSGFDPRSFEPLSVIGDAGADTFEVSFYEGPQSDGFGDVPSSYDLIILHDFAPGEDKVVIDADTQDEDYTLASGRIEEDVEEGITRLIITYEKTDAEDREINIVMNTVGVTWDDISFADGTTPPLLVPLA